MRNPPNRAPRVSKQLETKSRKKMGLTQVVKNPSEETVLNSALPKGQNPNGFRKGNQSETFRTPENPREPIRLPIKTN